MIKIERIDPRDPRALPLWQGSEDEQVRLYPPEALSLYTPKRLAEENIRFYLGTLDGTPAAIGGYKAHKNYADLKRIFVADTARGLGLGPALMAHLEREAGFESLPLMKLETGIHSPAAIKFYTRLGYRPCEKYGDFLGHPISVFMEKPLITTRPASPDEPATASLLRQSHALMQSLFPAETCHFLDFDALKAPNIRFFVATRQTQTLGTGALALKEGYAELKSMFVDTQARGSGAADAIMHRLESTASAEGITDIKLETGTGLDAAHRLYTRHGYTPCGPFGDYIGQDTAYNLYFEKTLSFPG
ncbi:MAG: GNAT family N-acetyltransferase [Pseudomonadota bacterium]